MLKAESAAPLHMNAQSFKTVYQNIITERLAAKNAGDKVKSEGLKLILNSTFGQLNEKFSPLYSPYSFLTITLSGQLTLMALAYKINHSK